MRDILLIGGVVFLLASTNVARAGTSADTARQSEDPLRIYHTREERRDAGIKHEITSDFTLAGLLELEHDHAEQRLRDGQSPGEESTSSSVLQLVIEYNPTDSISAELAYEYDSDTKHHMVDEAVIAYDLDIFDIEAGKLYLPFGRFYSKFIHGPSLEFGETRGAGLKITYNPLKAASLEVFTAQRWSDLDDSRTDSWLWGFAMESSPGDLVTLGFSYLSDMSSALEAVTSEKIDHSIPRIGGISGYALMGYDRFEMTFEYLQAIDSFVNLSPDTDRPRAWNLEIGVYPTEDIEWAFRIEGSNELIGSPKRQLGVSAGWRITPHILVSADILKGFYESNLPPDHPDHDVDSVYQADIRLSVEF